MWMWQETLLQKFVKFGVNLTFFAHLCYHGNGHQFEFFQTPPQKLPHTTVDIPTKFHEVWWKESKNVLNPPFLFPWQLRQSLSYRFQFFFGLSRSTRCGCDRKHYCKNLLSLEWIWHFLHLGYHGNDCHFELSSFINFCLASNLLWSFLCFFNFLAFWPFPWQWRPFWKNQPLKAQLHMAYDIPTRFHKVWSRHLREIERTKMCGRIIRIIIIVKKKRRIAIHHPTTVGVM